MLPIRKFKSFRMEGYFKTIPGDSKNVIVEIQCVSCRKTVEIKAPIAGIKARENGALIQNAFPFMSASDREMFISQICDECFPKEPDFDGRILA